MNSLSWLLYFADLANGLGVICSLLGLAALIAAVVAAVQILWKDDFYDDVKEAAFKLVAKRYAFRFLGVALVLFLVSAIIPARSTVYAIAASEYGEQLLKSPIGGKAEKALEAWLDRQIARPSKDKDE